MKFFVLLTLPLLVCAGQVASQDISWYRYGQITSFSIQPDVLSYRCSNAETVNLMSNLLEGPAVEKIETDAHPNALLVNVWLKPGISAAETGRIRSLITSQPGVENEWPCLYHGDAAADNSEKRWFTIDNKLSVVFQPGITETDIRAFATRNKLEIVYEPQGFTENFRGIYVFRSSLTEGLWIKARELWETESHLLMAVEPNMLNWASPSTSCPTNDPYWNALGGQNFLWHLDNTGTLKNTSGTLTSTPQADAGICECWQEGYNGSGKIIAVIDFDGFDQNHEDISGKYTSGWDCINNSPYNENTPLPSSPNYHGTAVSGLIAAKANNNKGIVGVAHGVKISPFMVTTSDGTSFTIALNNLNTVSPDVVNMSLEFSQDYSPWHIMMQNLVNQGRPDPYNANIRLGTILVASAGNSNSNLQNWPASWDEVIGVIASNPNDMRHSTGDGWGGSGSTFGLWYDVSAPGSFITTTTDMNEGNAMLGNNYVNTGGTSYASPIVAGIAAILLQKNPQLTWQQIHQSIRGGAKKVQGNTYNYSIEPNSPGKSSEMGFGRVDCHASLQMVPLSTEDHNTSQPGFVFNNPVQDHLQITAKDPGVSFTYRIFDMLGKVCAYGETNQNIQIPSGHWDRGYYMLEINSNGRMTYAKILKI